MSDLAMSKKRAFAQVDVFATRAMMGNPVAVVIDGEGLSYADMQAFAHWTNLSETTFVTPSLDDAADYNIRIYTPQAEMKFAGHPTLGTAHALIQAGRITPKNGIVRQRSAVGVVEVSVEEGILSFRLPQASIIPAPDPQKLTEALPGISFAAPPHIVDVGPRWVVAECTDADALAALEQDFLKLAAYDHAHDATGQTLYAVTSEGTILVRSFAAGHGIAEDPVCGSGNGAVAAYRISQGQITAGGNYTASQGRQAKRDGEVFVRIDEQSGIHVGGRCFTLIQGHVSI